MFRKALLGVVSLTWLLGCAAAEPVVWGRADPGEFDWGDQQFDWGHQVMRGQTPVKPNFDRDTYACQRENTAVETTTDLEYEYSYQNTPRGPVYGHAWVPVPKQTTRVDWDHYAACMKARGWRRVQ